MTKQKKEARFNLLIDTCVWLDVAKDYQQQAILAALEELIRQGDIEKEHGIEPAQRRRLSASNTGLSSRGHRGPDREALRGHGFVEISDSVKLRAAQRAIDKRAPFHRQRNGIDDAVLIEVYADAVTAKAAPIKA
jgi:hypothetical protein